MSGWEQANNLDERARYELFAWLLAFRDHWPQRFRSELGERGERLLAVLDATCGDPNRVLKLRRIALAEISHGRLRNLDDLAVGAG